MTVAGPEFRKSQVNFPYKSFPSALLFCHNVILPLERQSTLKGKKKDQRERERERESKEGRGVKHIQPTGAPPLVPKTAKKKIITRAHIHTMSSPSTSSWTNPVMKVRALTEVSERRKRASTYTDPLTKSPDMKEFLQTFYKNIYRQEKKDWYRAERAKYPTLQKNYEELCGKTVSYEDFWMRYERRCNVDRVMQELADKDAAQVEQTKRAVSDFVHKAWGTPTTTKPEDPTEEEERNHQSIPSAAATSTGESSNEITTPRATPTVRDEPPPSSPQPSLRESISKVLGTSNWSTQSAPAPAVVSNLVSQTEELELPDPIDQETTQEMQEISSLLGRSKTKGRHGVPETPEQNLILSELRKIMGTTKSKPVTNEQVSKNETASSAKDAKSSQESTTDSKETAAADDDLVLDNNMADAVAMVLFLVFLFISNLPFEKWTTS
jgi:hypothetical protein